MKKVIRDNRGCPLGWTDIKHKRGTFNEFVDDAGYTYLGTIGETLQSLDIDERQHVLEKGELY